MNHDRTGICRCWNSTISEMQARLGPALADLDAAALRQFVQAWHDGERACR